jgi:ABC-type phosphate transport system, periplasmic component
MKRFFLVLLALFCVVGVANAKEASLVRIKADLTKGDLWQQIVAESPFKLGEKTAIDGGLFSIDYGTYPCIDGSTVSLAMAMEFAWQHKVVPEKDVPGFVFLSTTHKGYEHLVFGKSNGASMVASEMAVMDESHGVDLFIGTEPSDEEKAMAEMNGVELKTEPVCLDAFVFITHKDNPIESLTTEQIKAVYQGRITNWKDVGGEDMPISAYRREKNSGSETGLEQLVMEGEPLPEADPVYTIGEMEGLVRRVGDYENGVESLGYTYLYYISNLYLNENVKVLLVDGVAPTAENIQSGAYPFCTKYYGVYRGGEENAAGGQFLKWMLSDEGQSCIAQAGYITLK